MDYLRARTIIGRLTFFSLLLFLCSTCANADPIVGANNYLNQQQASSACSDTSSFLSSHGVVVSINCAYASYQGNPSYLLEDSSSGYTYAEYYFWTGTYTPPSNCSSIKPSHTFQSGKILAGYTYSQTLADGSNCQFSVSPVGAPTEVDGEWQTYVTTTETGPAQAGDTPNQWEQNGQPVSPQPAPPSSAATAVDNTSPPSVCGGGSCYDTSTDQFCASTSSGQVCVAGPVARSNNAGQTGVGCATQGGSTLCAGSPPATPTYQAVQDPAWQIASSDKTVQADPTTGQTQIVTTNVYNQAAGASSSGATPKDIVVSNSSNVNQPASSSSSGSGAGQGNKGSWSGGGDCGSPPVCSGDAVICGVGQQVWYDGCQEQKADQKLLDGLGVGQDPGTTSASQASDAGSAWSGSSIDWGSQDSTAQAASQGHFDLSGLGFSETCPLTDLTVPLPDGRNFVLKSSQLCYLGDWVKALVIAFALFTAVKIVGGGLG